MTKSHILWYVLAFAVATLMLTLSGYAGYSYFAVAMLIGIGWSAMALAGFKAVDDRVWAKKLFIFSIIAITSLSVMMSVDFASPDPTQFLTSLGF